MLLGFERGGEGGSSRGTVHSISVTHLLKSENGTEFLGTLVATAACQCSA